MSRKKCDWIECQGDFFTWVCTRCETVYKPALPCSFPMMLTVIKQFMLEHKKCKVNPYLVSRRMTEKLKGNEIKRP